MTIAFMMNFVSEKLLIHDFNSAIFATSLTLAPLFFFVSKVTELALHTIINNLISLISLILPFYIAYTREVSDEHREDPDDSRSV
jgi:hypothetical protein